MKKPAILAMLLLALAPGAAAQMPALAQPQAQPQPQAQAALPVLEGTWSGTGEGIRMDGTTEKLNLVMVVDRQMGQLFIGGMEVDRLDAEGKVVDQEKLLFTGHLSGDLRLTMTLTPWPPPGAEPSGPASTVALFNGAWAADTITGVWENLTFGNTGWATLKKQTP